MVKEEKEDGPKMFIYAADGGHLTVAAGLDWVDAANIQPGKVRSLLHPKSRRRQVPSSTLCDLWKTQEAVETSQHQLAIGDVDEITDVEILLILFFHLSTHSQTELGVMYG